MKTALTIGFFDGVHLGHLALLKELRKRPHTTIVTFSNHPLEILHPPAPELLIPLEKKLELLKPFADELIVLPFTKEFSETPFDQFLDRFDLSTIILGAGSAFGKNREGNEKNIRKYAANKNIEVQFFPKILFRGEPVCSSRIRRALQEGNTHLANELLGKI
jgi:FAD synthase